MGTGSESMISQEKWAMSESVYYSAVVKRPESGVRGNRYALNGNGLKGR